jgi:hypothetical protein
LLKGVFSNARNKGNKGGADTAMRLGSSSNRWYRCIPAYNESAKIHCLPRLTPISAQQDYPTRCTAYLPDLQEENARKIWLLVDLGCKLQTI